MFLRYLACLFFFTSFSIHAQQVALSGTVTKDDGSPAAGLIVVLEDNSFSAVASDTTDLSGNYALNVNTGTYSQLRVRNIGKELSGFPKTIEYTAFSNLAVSSALVKDIKLPKYVHIHGLVKSSTGQFIPGAKVNAVKWKMHSFTTPYDDTISADDGSYSIYQEAGDSTRFTIDPPSGYHAAKTDLFFLFNKDTVQDLILPVTILLHGVVTNFNGDTLKNIGVTAQYSNGQIDSFTNSSGQYQIPVTPGKYKIRLRNQGFHGPVKGAPYNLEETAIDSVFIQNDTVINLKLPFYPRAYLTVKNGNSDPVDSVTVESGVYQSGSITGLPQDRGVTGSSGTCTLYVKAGVVEFKLTPLANSGYIGSRPQISVNKDTNIVLTALKGTTLSGTAFHNDSTPVKGLMIAIERDANQLQTFTDSTGHYSILLEPAVYRIRARNTGSVIAGIPTSLEYTVAETLTVNQSRQLNFVLPRYPTITGTIKDASGHPVSNVGITIHNWNQGMSQPPYVQTVSGLDGKYSITIGSGTNKVWIQTPAGSPYGSFNFIESFDSSRVKDIVVPDKAHGITRIQPSVITTGISGKVMITGINTHFTSGNISINLGDGITVSNVSAISNITLTADIAIAQEASTGSRNVVVKTDSGDVVGPDLLTVTSPASAKVNLDNAGKTTKDIKISDGTGTELLIPAGTPVKFPAGSDSVISYSAPIIKNEAPDKEKFTEVQRELKPSGLTFQDTVIMTCQYKDQDVIGMKKSELKPVYYVDDSIAHGGGANDTMHIIRQDTASNSISFALPHFSMFRLATNGAPVNVITKAELKIDRSALSGIITGTSYVRIPFFIAPSEANALTSLEIIDIRGKIVRTLINGVLGSGNFTAHWDCRNNASQIVSSGTYLVRFKAGRSNSVSTIQFVR